MPAFLRRGPRARTYEARIVHADGEVDVTAARTPGEAARLVHERVWDGPEGLHGEVWQTGRTPRLMTSMRRIAARAVLVTNHLYGTAQYEYNPSPARPHERHWSPVWPPAGIPYADGAPSLV